MSARQRVLVSGVVQGVFFRDECRAAATRSGVAGWVRNRRDGRVEAVFEGAPDAVAAMVDWCRTGPARAAVDGIETHDEQPEGLTGFSITATT